MAMTLDAPQQALSFLISQQTQIEPQVYRIQYPDITYAQFIPVDTSAWEWADTITVFSMDRAGRAEWFRTQSQDVPAVGTSMEKFVEEVRTAAIGYNYNEEELARASRLGIALQSDRAEAARRAYEEFVEDVAYNGDANVGLQGLLSHSAVTVASAGTGNWLNANTTPAQILSDINTALTGIYTGTKTVEMADTVLMPIEQYDHIASTARSDTSDTTILTFLRENNVYTARTGQPLAIQAMRQLNGAGAASADRMVAYRRDPQVLKLHLPMPHRFTTAMRSGPYSYVVPGMFRMGGVEIRRPGAVRYIDGI